MRFRFRVRYCVGSRVEVRIVEVEVTIVPYFFQTVPATPSELSIVPGHRELNLVWVYRGDADNFTIIITPNHGIAVFNGDFTDPAAEVTGLTPGTTYDIAIVTVSGDERSEPITETARTRPYSEFKQQIIFTSFFLLSSTPF